MISPRCWRRSACSSPTRRTSAARSSTVDETDHSRCAASARPIAASRSASLIVGYSLTLSPVAGLTTAYWLMRFLRCRDDSGRRRRRAEARDPRRTDYVRTGRAVAERCRAGCGLRDPRADEPALVHDLGELDRVRRGALAQVVRHDPHLERLVVARVAPDPADEDIVMAVRVDRHRIA